ncbi:MAG: AAA family ATPase [Sedimentisphaerales bacterium]|nr:AAA family ATPase [Sedimentisphaerales bacterium]
MKTIVTGTVGLDKVPYLQRVERLARQRGHQVSICHVGRRMYAEAPDVAPGRILDLPLSRLHLLRRSVIKDILVQADRQEHLIVNTHATFRWRHGLFPAFDFDQFARLDADMYVCLLDTVEMLHARLLREHQVNHSLKDLLVWREEELLGTEMMRRGCSLLRDQDRPPAPFYVMAIGGGRDTTEMFYRLMFEPRRRKAYISFPMTHVVDLPDKREEIDDFRRRIKQHFTVFDPADMEEYQLYHDAVAASERGQKVLELEVAGEPLRFEVSEVLQAAGDINAQIYARDFMLIDQSDMIISYIPELSGGRPALSSGVERELQHAYEATREVYVIWRPAAAPSPFVTETATALFASLDEAMQYFHQKDYLAGP